MLIPKIVFECPHCGSRYWRARGWGKYSDELQCGRHGCYRWSFKCFEEVQIEEST